MKRFIFQIVCVIVFIFGSAYASSEKVLNYLTIDMSMPYLNEEVITNVTVRSNYIKLGEVIWYKDNKPYTENIFTSSGKYSCRIYLIPNEGYTIGLSCFVSNALTEDCKVVKDYKGFYAECVYDVKARETLYPDKISFSNMTIPTLNSPLDFSITSDNPTYYDVKKIDWYYEGELCYRFGPIKKRGEYICRVYFDMYNGFELTSNLYASIDRRRTTKITKEASGTYFEIVYIIGEAEVQGEVNTVRLSIDKIPTYGQSLDNVVVKKQDKTEFYEIGSVEWYRNDFRMLDKYFYDGQYKCRIYLNFINGGYPSSKMIGYINNSAHEKDANLMNGKYYFEQVYNIKEYVISTVKFNELNIPEYGGVPDTNIISLEPGIYTPSMVYWYDKSGKYLSNMDTFKEGTYKCKFTLEVNPNCSMKNKITGLINEQSASVYMENNKLTVECTYEVKKSETLWKKASDWAEEELKDSINYALIPIRLQNEDLTTSITREEFAAVAVRMYERISYKSAVAVTNNPFTDTKNTEVLKAYNLGITNGTSETTFEPNSLITRQEMATMMLRALKKAGVSTSVNLNAVRKFSDHYKIDSWALNGVYFMSNVGIIKGKGNNTFDVLGNATREEALAISIRSVNLYK